MSNQQFIERTLKAAAQRRRLVDLWRAFWWGVLAGGAVWLVVAGIYKLFPLPPMTVVVAGMAAGLTLVAFLIAALCRRSSLLETARWVDERQHLEERLSTALELSHDSRTQPWKELVLADAAQHAKAVKPDSLAAFRFPVVGRWAVLVLVLGVTLGFVPEYRTQAYVQRQQEIDQIRQTGKQLVELTRRSLEHRPPALETTHSAMEAVLETGDQLAKHSLTRSEALRELSKLTDRLSEQTEQLRDNPALRRMEQAARDPERSQMPSPAELQRQMEALQEQLGETSKDPAKLDRLQRQLDEVRKAASELAKGSASEQSREQMAQAMEGLAQQARELGASVPGLEEAIAALRADQSDLFLKNLDLALADLEKMKQMAQAMQQLEQQLAKLGKDLAEQLEKGQAQAAQSTLREMIKQLESSDLSTEEKQKIVEEVSKAIQPAGEYGKVAQYLKQATAQMKQGDNPGAAQSLADAAKELDRLMQQMADSQALQDALEALQKAQMAIAMGKNWDQLQGACAACQGAGCGRCQGGPGGKPGYGVGTWADEGGGWTYFEKSDEAVDNSGVERPDLDPRGLSDRPDNLNPNLTPTKLRGQLSPGSSMPSITLKGVSIKGQSKVAFEEAAAAAQSDAQSALNQDLVPKPYQNSVRDYFDDIKK